MRKTVTRCICRKVSFQEIKEYARDNNLNLEDMIEKDLCCTSCKMCYPYVKKMMHTGETAFSLGDYYINEDL